MVLMMDVVNSALVSIGLASYLRETLWLAFLVLAAEKGDIRKVFNRAAITNARIDCKNLVWNVLGSHSPQ